MLLKQSVQQTAMYLQEVPSERRKLRYLIGGTLLTVGVMFTTIDWLRPRKPISIPPAEFLPFFAKSIYRYDYFGHFDDDLQSTMDLCFVVPESSNLIHIRRPTTSIR